MYVSPATTYNELVNAMNNNNNKRCTNTADVSIHVFVVLPKIYIKILLLLLSVTLKFLFRMSGRVVAKEDT